MKILINCDKVNETNFSNLSKFYTEDDEVMFISTGLEGNVGDWADYLRSLGNVVFTEGLPVVHYAVRNKNFIPDVIVNSPQNA